MYWWAMAGGLGAGWVQRRRWWWTWAQCEGVGIQRLGQLEREFGDLEAAWWAEPGALAALPGIGPELLASKARLARRLGASRVPLTCPPRTFLPGDPGFPPGMAALERPPLQLHWQGRGSLWPPLRSRFAVAVVGTRRPSLHGLSWARRLGVALAGAGWPVVSGLAEGIDGEAHQGCLEQGGAPVGVLATPIERVYPSHHRSLQRQVAERGLLVTEQRAGAEVKRGNFAARNRLLVALARAVVVVECPSASGALHGARLARDAKIPLWAVPADTDRDSARGSNDLLREGAKLLLDPADLLASLGPGPLAASAGLPPPLAPGVSHPLLAALGQGASLEELGQRLQQPLPQLAQQLLELELAGLVQPAGGLCWRPRHNGCSPGALAG